VVIPVVETEARWEERDTGGEEREHVGPEAEAEAVLRGGGVETGDVAGEVGGEADLGDLGAGERVFAEVETFVEAAVDLAGGAEGGKVGEETGDEFGEAWVEGADLAGGEGGAGGGVAQFVQVAPLGGFDEVLGVAEEIGDGDGLDAVGGGGGDELAELFPRVGVGAGDAGEGRVIDGVFEMEVETLVAPLGVEGQEGEEVIEALDLASEVPLEGAEHIAKRNDQ
jgi:hypothetical protein